MSVYDYHVFFCNNQRDCQATRDCCNNHNANAMLTYAKQQAQALNIAETTGHRIRIQRAGCFDRCELGPLLVVYPDAVWYTYIDESDIDEILTEHLQHGRIVERLRVADYA